MKIKSASKTCFSVMLSCAAVVCYVMLQQTASAAEDKKCTVNDVELSVGDVFTYTLDIADADENYSGIDVSLYYDPEVLSVDADKISLPVFQNAMFNSQLDGEIRFNAIDVTDGYDLKTNKTVICAAFKILDSQKSSTNITYSIRELYNMETEKVTDYNTAVSIKKGEPPADSIVKPKSLDEVEQSLVSAYENEASAGTSFPALWFIAGGALICGAAAIIIAAYVQKKKKDSSIDEDITKN